MRLFLALDLSRELRAEVTRVAERLAGSLAGWRFVDPAGIHLTLRFLGEVAAERDRAQREVWRGAVRGFSPIRFGLGKVGVFPGSARPRVLWIGVREVPPQGRIEALARALEQAARASGFRPEERPFRPHLTLARARNDARAGAPREELAEPQAWTECEEVLLVQSELGAGGARYTRLEAFPLSGTGSA